MEKDVLSLFDCSKLCDIDLIMRYEEFISLLFHIHKMKSQLQSIILPKYGAKDKASISLEIFERIIKDLHEVWKCNLPCDSGKINELHTKASPSFSKTLTIDECTAFFTSLIKAQYEALKAEMTTRKLLLSSFIVCKFITRPVDMLKDMSKTCEECLKDLPKYIEKYEPYFVEEGKADKFTFRDALRTLIKDLSCKNDERPDLIFDEVFNQVDTDKDGKISKEELGEYIKKAIEEVRSKLLEVIENNK